MGATRIKKKSVSIVLSGYLPVLTCRSLGLFLLGCALQPTPIEFLPQQRKRTVPVSTSSFQQNNPSRPRDPLNDCSR